MLTCSRKPEKELIMRPARSCLVLLFAVLFVCIPILSAAEDEIRIGAVLPLTGKESKIGGAFKAATELAVKEVNDAGGLQVGRQKMKIDLRLLDDTSDASKSAQLVEQLIVQQKVHAVIGGSGASAIYGRSKWVFGTLSPVEDLAKTQMDFLSDLQKSHKLKTPLRISLVKENTEHGKDFEKGVLDYVKAHPRNFSVVLDESFELYAPDYRPLLSRVENAKGDVFMCDAHLEDFIAMQRTYTQMGLYHQMVTYGARGADEAARKALGPATDYIFASGWW